MNRILKAWYKFDDNYMDTITGSNLIKSDNTVFSEDSIINKAMYVPHNEAVLMPFSSL